MKEADTRGETGYYLPLCPSCLEPNRLFLSAILGAWEDGSCRVAILPAPHVPKGREPGFLGDQYLPL